MATKTIAVDINHQFLSKPVRYILSVWESSYDEVNNTSVVIAELTAKSDLQFIAFSEITITINGVCSTILPGYYDRRPSQIRVRKTYNISHGNDGKKTIDIILLGYAGDGVATYQWHPYGKTATGTLVLHNNDRSVPQNVKAVVHSNFPVTSRGEMLGFGAMTIRVSSTSQYDQISYRVKPKGGSYGGWIYENASFSSLSPIYNKDFMIQDLVGHPIYVIQVSVRKANNHMWGYASEIELSPLGASTITSVSNVTLGNKVSVTWTPYFKDLSYILTFKYKSWKQTVTVSPKLSNTPYTYTGLTVPKSIAGTLVDATSDNATVTLETIKPGLNNSRLKRSISSKTFKINIPSDMVPTISDVAVSEGTASGFGYYTQSLSTVKCVIHAAPSYSSPVKKAHLIFDGKTYSATPSSGTYVFTINTNKISSYGNALPIKITVTDARGRTSSTYTTSVKVYQYFKPTINIGIDITGTTVTTTYTGKLASVNKVNTRHIKIVRTKLTTGETYTREPTISYNHATQKYSLTLTDTLSDYATQTYEYYATITDKKYKTSSRKQTAVVCISRLGGGKGVTLFKEATDEGFWVGNIDYTLSDSEYTELDNLIG